MIVVSRLCYRGAACVARQWCPHVLWRRSRVSVTSYWSIVRLLQVPCCMVTASLLCQRIVHMLLIFKAKLKLESGNQKIQYGHQADILKVTSLKINRLLPMTTINMHMKFEIEIPKQTWLTSRKPCHLQSPETEKSNMAARRPFWKWCCWKSIGYYPHT